MSKYKDLTLVGQGHWSVRGELESPKWNWWFEIKGASISDEAMREVMLTGEKGVAFIKEMKPYLPLLLQEPCLGQGSYVSVPCGIPGGTWDMSVPLNDCLDPEGAEKVLQKHFPALYALA